MQIKNAKIQQEFLKAGVHFGHLTRKWNPKIEPYILMKKKGIHLINLSKTIKKLAEACNYLRTIASLGKKILFVCTKKQGKYVIEDFARSVNMPYVTERWMAGLLTNFSTIRKSIKNMDDMENKKKEGIYDMLSKKERLFADRIQEKLKRNLSSISSLNHIPSALFIVDICKEHIALSEAKKLKIPVFAMVDTNSDPTKVDYPIPSNDDYSKSIRVIASYISKSILEGFNLRKTENTNEEENHTSKDSDL